MNHESPNQSDRAKRRRPLRSYAHNVTVVNRGPSFFSMLMAVIVGLIFVGILFVLFLGCGLLSLASLG